MRRVIMVLVVAGFLLCAAGVAWGYHARVWLMDDYRAGYSRGQELAESSNNADNNDCLHEMHLRLKAEHRAHNHNSDAAWDVGCFAGVSGGSNDWIHVRNHMSD